MNNINGKHSLLHCTNSLKSVIKCFYRVPEFQAYFAFSPKKEYGCCVCIILRLRQCPRPCPRHGDRHLLLPIGGAHGRERPIGGLGGRGGRVRRFWRFYFSMAEASSVNAGSGCEEKGPEELSQESARPGTIISRVKLFDTMVDTFLQKLIAAGR